MVRELKEICENLVLNAKSDYSDPYHVLVSTSDFEKLTAQLNKMKEREKNANISYKEWCIESGINRGQFI